MPGPDGAVWLRRQSEVQTGPDLTVFADASCYHQKQLAGWGAWAKGDGRQSTARGGKLTFTPNTAVLELRALANMLWSLRATGYLLDTDRVVMLQCDNAEALECLLRHLPNVAESRHENGAALNARRHVTGPYLEAAEVVCDVLGDRRVLIRHVRGHQGGGGRNWVNRVCDDLAKAGALGKPLRGWGT